MTKISDKQLKKLPPKADLKAPVEKAAKAAAKAGAAIGKKFGKDEMSMGLGKALRLKSLKQEPGSLLEQLKKKPLDLGELGERIHDYGVARQLQQSINGQLKLVKLGPALSPAAAPKQGIDGNWYAPNGHRLIEVPLSNSKSGKSTALVDPLSNEYYLKSEGFLNPGGPSMRGPVSLPKDAHFKDQEFTAQEYENLEKAAKEPKRGLPTAPRSPQSPPLFPQGPQHPLPFPMKPGTSLPGLPISPGERKAIEKWLNKGVYDAPAPKPADVLSETPLKNEHPFSYTLVRLKSDPDHVVIKRVLTGGIVAPKPGDGSYSAPIPL